MEIEPFINPIVILKLEGTNALKLIEMHTMLSKYSPRSNSQPRVAYKCIVL